MKKDLITIVMPTFNDEKYLKKSIQDILNQTYDNFELIIVNDGSEDNSEEIILSFCDNDNRIKYFKKEKS